MKFYKLRRLIYFFLYKLNRWLGGKTKWEYRDWQVINTKSWEVCEAIERYNKLKMQMEHGKLSPFIFMILEDWAREIRETT